jgi:transposase-like protein
MTTENTPIPGALNNVIRIDDEQIKGHLDRVVRGTVEETLNALLESEADRLCNAQRYERTEARRDTRAGHYERNLETKAGEVTLKVPKLRRQTFETAIIERYRRRETSVEEALIEMYLAGIFVRRVEDITEALRGTRVSPSTVSDLNKKIYATIEAREKAQRVGAKLREQHMSKAAELVEGGVRETLAYYAFPEEHWRRIRTNNPLERILREIRRRTRVVGAFPNGQSALNLAAARLRHVAGTEWSTKRYLSMDFLKDHQTTRTNA